MSSRRRNGLQPRACWSWAAGALALFFVCGCNRGANPSGQAGATGNTPAIKELDHPRLKPWGGKPIAEVRAAATNQNAGAQYFLAWTLFRGEGIEQNVEESFHWFEQAASNGVAEAQIKLGVFYEQGLLVNRDPAQAATWYRLAADQGNAVAQYRVANFPAVTNGPGMLTQPEREEYVRKAAAQQYPPAELHMAGFDPARTNRAEALKWIERAARHGLASAQYQWSGNFRPIPDQVLKMKGQPERVIRGQKGDVIEQLKWASLAADGGDAGAYSFLLSVENTEDPKEMAEGRRRAEQFVPDAGPRSWGHEHGLLYAFNPAAPREPGEDRRGRYVRLVTGASRSEPDAMFNLGLSLMHPDLGVDYLARKQLPVRSPYPDADFFPLKVSERSDAVAAWFDRAADKGHEQAQWLAALQHAGAGQWKQAAIRYEQAAKQGHARSQFNLAMCYQRGDGVTQSMVECLRWLRQAAGQGDPEALRELRELGDARSSSQAGGPVQTVTPSPVGAGARTVRLAVLAADDSLQPAADLLVATFSRDPALALVERAQVNKIMGELRLTATATLNPLRAGQLLGADGVLLLETMSTGTNRTLGARLVAVQPGAVLAWQEYPWPSPDTEGWSGLVREQFNGWFPKLAVAAKEALPVSVLNLRSAVGMPESQRLERDLTLLFTRRLAAERQLFVLERRQMEMLEREKFFGSEENKAFWSGAYLVDGVIDRAGLDRTNATLNLRVMLPGGGTAATVEVAGMRDQLPGLADKAVAGLLDRLQRHPVGEWNALDEAARYADEAQWALRFGMNQEAEAAAESAWALGLRARSAVERHIHALLRQSDLSIKLWDSGRMISADPVTADAGKAKALTKALELILERTVDSRLEAWRDEAWFGLCEQEMLRATQMLQAYHSQHVLREACADELNHLRALVRELDALLLGFPTARDRGERLLVTYGVWWQDQPKAAAGLLALLVESGTYRRWAPASAGWSVPGLVGWTSTERLQMDEVWEELLGWLCRSTNASTRLEGCLWQVAASQAEYVLEDAVPLLSQQLREFPPAYWPTPPGDAVLAATEKQLERLGWQPGSSKPAVDGGTNARGAMTVATHLRGQLIPELAQVVATNRAVQKQLQVEADRQRLFARFVEQLKSGGHFFESEFRSLQFTTREAEEVLPFWDAYKKQFPYAQSLYSSIDTALRSKLPATNQAPVQTRPEPSSRDSVFATIRQELNSGKPLEPMSYLRTHGIVCSSMNAQEVQEFLQLVKVYRARHPQPVSSLDRFEEALRSRQAMLKQIAEQPAPGAPSAVSAKTNNNASLLRPDRFWLLPDAIPLVQHTDGFEIVPLGERSGRFWMQINVADRRASDLFRRYIVAVQPDTFATETFPVPLPPRNADQERGYPAYRMDTPGLEFEIQQETILLNVGSGLKTCNVRTRQWSDAPFNLPERVSLFGLGDRLFATSPDSIMELDVRQGSVKILASCRRQPPLTVLDRLEGFNSPVIFSRDPSRPCLLLGTAAYAYEPRKNDWQPMDLDLEPYRGWGAFRQGDGQLFLMPPSGGRDGSLKVALLAGQTAASGGVSNPGTNSPVPLYGGDIWNLVKDHPDLAPGLKPRFGPWQGPGWAVAAHEAGTWFVVSAMAGASRQPGKPSDLGKVILMRFGNDRRRPMIVPVWLTMPASASGMFDSTVPLPLQEDGIRLAAFGGGLAVFPARVPGFWFLSDRALKPSLDQHAQEQREWDVKRLAMLESRQAYWLQLFDTNKNNKLDADELDLAGKNQGYVKEQQELAELRKRVTSWKGKRSAP